MNELIAALVTGAIALGLAFTPPTVPVVYVAPASLAVIGDIPSPAAICPAPAWQPREGLTFYPARSAFNDRRDFSPRAKGC